MILVMVFEKKGYEKWKKIRRKNSGRFRKGDLRAKVLGRLGGMASPTKFREGEIRAKKAGRKGGRRSTAER